MVGLVEHPAGVHLDPVRRRDDDHRGLDRGERFERRADEVRGAGGVEDVQVLAVVVGVEDVGVDGEVVLVFLLVEVGDGRAVVHAPHPIDRVGLEEQGIGQAGLARGAVPHECNVPDVLHQVLDGHETAPLRMCGETRLRREPRGRGGSAACARGKSSREVRQRSRLSRSAAVRVRFNRVVRSRLPSYRRGR